MFQNKTNCLFYYRKHCAFIMKKIMQKVNFKPQSICDPGPVTSSEWWGCQLVLTLWEVIEEKLLTI